jgi:hypothetical protein
VKEKWEAVELEDGRIRVQIDGVDDILIVNEPPGTGRKIHIYGMVQHHLARREIERVREIQRLAEASLEKLAAHHQTASAPPVIAELVLSFLAPRNSAQAQLGDLQEMFHKNVDRLGEQQARRKYWLQVANSLAPLLWQWLKRVGFVTMLVDYVRSKFGL